MTNTSARTIWEILLAREIGLATSDTIRGISDRIRKDPSRSIRYLQEHGYITRIFRGIFYVNSPRERATGTISRSIYEIVGEALAMKGVKNWYFGLETALRINGLTHEYFAVNYLMTDSYRTTKAIRIADMKFRLLRRSKEHFTFGVVKKYDLRFSDKEKTVLDLVHKRYLDTRNERIASTVYAEYRGYLDREKVSSYLDRYPEKIRAMIGRMS